MEHLIVGGMISFFATGVTGKYYDSVRWWCVTVPLIVVWVVVAPYLGY